MIDLCLPRLPCPADPDRPWCQVYEIQAGDTTTSVAKLFNITEDQLIALNSGGCTLHQARTAAAQRGERCVAGLTRPRRADVRLGLQACMACVAPPPNPALPCPTTSLSVPPRSDYLADGWKLPFAGQYVRIPGW